jgi:thioredoxin 1
MTRKVLPFAGLVALVALCAFTLSTPFGCKPNDAAPASAAPAAAVPAPPQKKADYQPAGPEIAEYRAKGLPMVLDFGRGWCKPCKAMAPDLETLHHELAGKVLVRFNELDKEKDLAAQHKIQMMPTQVYIDAKGQEVYRHVGYASKADMLAKMKELGFL